MEALQRSVLSNNWITLIFVFSILLLFFLKLFTTAKLKGYVTSLFNRGFVEIEAEENYWALSFFHTGFSLFTFLMLSWKKVIPMDPHFFQTIVHKSLVQLHKLLILILYHFHSKNVQRLNPFFELYPILGNLQKY